MIGIMVVIGGITRLTESGLSIAEWRPLSGILPPLGEADWQRLHDLYRETPEYRKLNAGMTLLEFKTIFWWEYAHRLWGRLIGLAYALPFFWFLATGRLAARLRRHLWAILALGALQGLLGWLMVASGLIDRPSVSQYRLAAHLLLALVIYAYILRLAFALLRPAPPPPGARGLRAALGAVTALAFVTMATGGFVAGLDAGAIYNTFPLMGGRLVPGDLLALSPAWLNPFENPAAAQFAHRWLAVALVVSCASLWAAHWAAGRRAGLARPGRSALAAVAAIAVVQAALGIATLLLVVPVPLAAAHQGGAVLLLGSLIWALGHLGPAAGGSGPVYNREPPR
jgi:cytochrome c oxidase assembly protein subunit 15